MTPERLRIEYLESPLGIDEKRPRFSWRVADDQAGAMQAMYQIRVSADGRICWDSGEVASGACFQIEYEGPELSPRQIYSWNVRLRNKAGEWGPWSETSSCETGIMGDWHARWIRGTNSGAPCQPATYFRKVFYLEESPARARLYVTALGLYQPTINGRAITDYGSCPAGQTISIGSSTRRSMSRASSGLGRTR